MSETIVPAGGPARGRPVSPSGLDRRWLGLIGLVVIVAAAFVYLHGGHSENLTQTGGHAVGRVEGYQAGAEAGTAHPILVVDYTVGTGNYRARITLDASTPAYAKGRSVTVYYNQSQPTDVVVDGHGNSSKKKPVLLTVVLVLVGVALIAGAFASGGSLGGSRSFRR